MKCKNHDCHCQTTFSDPWPDEQGYAKGLPFDDVYRKMAGYVNVITLCQSMSRQLLKECEE